MIEALGKIFGFDGIFENAHIFTARGHSKQTWFIDSSSTTKIIHCESHLMSEVCKFFMTGTYPYIAGQTNCLNFGGHCKVHVNASRGFVSGLKNFRC